MYILVMPVGGTSISVLAGRTPTAARKERVHWRADEEGADGRAPDARPLARSQGVGGTFIGMLAGRTPAAGKHPLARS